MAQDPVLLSFVPRLVDTSNYDSTAMKKLKSWSYKELGQHLNLLYRYMCKERWKDPHALLRFGDEVVQFDIHHSGRMYLSDSHMSKPVHYRLPRRWLQSIAISS